MTSFLKDLDLLPFRKQRFFLHQRRLPQAKIFPSSKKFSTTKDFSFLMEVFHKPRFIQGSFLQAKICSLSGNFSINKNVSLIKEVFLQVEQRFFLFEEIFPWAKIFSRSMKFSTSNDFLWYDHKSFLEARSFHPYTR